jgi:hypothetical protein
VNPFRVRWNVVSLRRLFFSLSAVGTLLIEASTSSAQTLTQSLDATNLVWTTAGNAGWQGQTNFTIDGIDAGRSGLIGDTGETYIQTTVTGPGTISFWWLVSSQPNADFLQFWVGTNLVDQISGFADWTYREYTLSNGVQSLNWRYVKDANLNSDLDAGFVDRVIFSPVPKIPLQQALNTCGINWTSGGNSNTTYWSGQTNITHDGKIAAQSGAVYHNQESWMSTTVMGATNVTFWWKVSSEQDFDFLNFYLGTNLLAAISGEVNWTNRSFNLPAGTNELRWQYIKDVSVTMGADAGWVDQVVINHTNVALPYQFTSAKRLSGQRFSFNITGEVGCGCSVESSTNLVNWQVFSNFITTNATHTLIDDRATNYVTRYFRARSS